MSTGALYQYKRMKRAYGKTKGRRGRMEGFNLLLTVARVNSGLLWARRQLFSLIYGKNLTRWCFRNVACSGDRFWVLSSSLSSETVHQLFGKRSCAGWARLGLAPVLRPFHLQCPHFYSLWSHMVHLHNLSPGKNPASTQYYVVQENFVEEGHCCE